MYFEFFWHMYPQLSSRCCSATSVSSCTMASSCLLARSSWPSAPSSWFSLNFSQTFTSLVLNRSNSVTWVVSPSDHIVPFQCEFIKNIRFFLFRQLNDNSLLRVRSLILLVFNRCTMFSRSGRGSSVHACHSLYGWPDQNKEHTPIHW